jgi:hypothetical protein
MMKCVPGDSAQLLLVDFEVFRQNLENVAKVPGSHKDIKGFVPVS